MTEAPALKFLCHLVSHIYFTALLIVEILAIYQPIYATKEIWPNPIEWVLLLWLSGLLVAELSQPGSRTGLGVLKIAILFFAAIAVMMHVAAFIFPDYIWQFNNPDEQSRTIYSMLYIKNQFFALVCLMCFVGFLEFLTVHHLFGPWAIIIRDLMYDLMRFLVILLLFIIGFTMHVTSIFQPAFESSDESQAQLAQPLQTLEMLFFALFGVVDPDQMPPLHRTPDFSIAILKVIKISIVDIVGVNHK